MNQSVISLWYFTLTLVCYILCGVSGCVTDCTGNRLKGQSYCQVIEIKSELKCEASMNNLTKTGYGDGRLPLDLQIDVHSPGKVDIKWKSPDPIAGHQSTERYMLKVWSYKDILKDGFHFNFEKCYIHNRTESTQKENKVFINCIERSRYIHLVALPQQDPEKDYIHRSITIYNHTHKDRTEWKPSFISVHNDSCSNRIEVEFEFAPNKYRFPGYMVAIRIAPDTGFQSDVKSKAFKEREKRVVFENIEDGHYQILILMYVRNIIETYKTGKKYFSCIKEFNDLKMELEEIFLQGDKNISENYDKLHLGNLNDFITKQVENIEQATINNVPEGRLGPEEVLIDIDSCVGTNIIGVDRLMVTSHCNFSTVLANACVYKGCWQYEVMLGSKGVMQIGWGTKDCKFSLDDGIGVGDTVDSYSYDGQRILKWNNETSREYGDMWMAGDIVTCTLDCDKGEVAFYRDGLPLGVAYTDIKLGPGIAYFPGCSLSLTENVIFNFGATPFRHPVPGFSPLHISSTKDVKKAELLCNYLEKLIEKHTSPKNKDVTQIQTELKKLSINPTNSAGPTKTVTISSSSVPMISQHAQLLLVGSHILEYLGPLLKVPYIIQRCLMSLCRKLIDVNKWREPQEGVTCLLDVLTGLLQEDEYKACMEHLVVGVSRLYRYTTVNDGYTLQKAALVTFLCIMRHPQARLHAVKHVLFEHAKLPMIIHIKPPTEKMLEEMYPDVWWEPLESTELSSEEQSKKDAYYKNCYDFGDGLQDIEDIQFHILRLLMTNDDSIGTKGVTTRFVFLQKFRKFVHDYVYKLGVCEYPWPIGLAFFHRMVGVIRSLWDKQAESCKDAEILKSSEAFVSPKKFYDNSLSFYEVNRLGGLPSHLFKTHKVEVQNKMLKAAGIDEKMPLHQAYIQHNKVLAQSHSEAYADQLSASTSQTDSLQELIDGLAWLYTISAHKQLTKVTAIREAINDYKITLKDIEKKLSKCPVDMSKVREELVKSKSIVETIITKQTRQMSWLIGYIMTEDKRNDIYWLLRVLLRTLEKSSELGSLFVFVPEYYMATVIQAYQAVKIQFDGLVPFHTIEDYDTTLHKFAVFLSNHFTDDRIVNADCNRVITEVLASFISYPETLKALENIHELNRIKIVKALLLPYEDRSWVQSNWILARIWKGSGFAFRYKIAPHLSRNNIQYADLFDGVNQEPCPSEVFKKHIKENLYHNPDMAAKFVDSLLNQLNWSFSEFTGMIQELHALSQRTESALIDARQLKLCAACFDIAVNLLRVVEFLVALVPEVFLDFTKNSAELSLCRLCQSLSQILSRVTSKSHAFDILVNSRIPGMEVIDHFPILAALTGTLVRLIYSENDLWKQRATTALLHEPSFQPIFLDFLVADTANKSTESSEGATASETKTKPEGNKFSLRNFEEVSSQELEQVESLIKHLKQHKATMRSTSLELDEDTVCKICYANPQAVVFRPCGHMSCRSCIAQHMMHNKACFFCQQKVNNVEHLDEGTPV